MGSVINHIECPRCFNEAVEDFYYKTGEFAISCNQCGYGKSKFIRRDDAGNVVLKDPSKPIKEDNLLWDEDELTDPWGCYHIVYADGITQVGSLESEDDYIDFGQFAKSDKAQQSNVSMITVSHLVENGEIETILLHQNPDAKPKAIREYPSDYQTHTLNDDPNLPF